MIRRTFISSLGNAVLAVTAGSLCTSVRAEQNSQYLVDSPLKREEYLRKMLKLICTDIGPHRFGTPEYEKVALILKKEMMLAAPHIEQDMAPFSMWEPTSGPEFRVGNMELETKPYKGIAGTPKGGSTGILKKGERENSYTIVDPNTEAVMAKVMISTYGRAVSSSAYRNDREISYVDPARPMAPPIFNIGKQDVPILEKAMKNRTPVRVNIQTHFLPPKLCSSIIGTIPGKSTEEILFIAHADSPYESPGANDNMASVIVMLMLAHAFSGTVPNRTLTFVASGGEEDGKVGAIHYAEKRKQEGTMKNIRFVVNFDSLTYGPNLQIYSKEKDLKDIIRAIHHDLNIKADPKYVDRDGYTMDSLPFRPSGGKAMYVNSRGYDGITLPVFHRGLRLYEKFHSVRPIVYSPKALHHRKLVSIGFCNCGEEEVSGVKNHCT